MPTSTDRQQSEPPSPSWRSGHTEIGSAQILTCEDEHDQTDGEKGGRQQGDQTGIVGPERTRAALDQLNHHGSET